MLPGFLALGGDVGFFVGEGGEGVFGGGVEAAGTSYAIPASYTPDPDVAPPTANNPFSGAGKYPGVGAFHDQRLIYARTDEKPQSFWGSVVGDFENLNKSSPVRDDDGFNFTINSAQVNEIRWMVSIRDLIIGTSGAEWKLSGAGGGAGVTPTSVQLTRQSRWGVSHLPPIVVGNSVLFVDGSRRKVRDLTYSLQVDGYDGNDLTILAQHLFEASPVKEWAYQPWPDPTLWAVREDGTLLGLTYHREHQVTAWHHHDTDGLFESVAVIQTGDGASEVWFLVRRTVGGQTKRYVERLHTRDFTEVADAFFVDSGLSYDGAPATEISGLDHLEGKAVAVLADGNVVEGLSVASGKITLPNAASLVHVGLPYTCDLETLAFEFQTPKGTLQDKKRAIFSSLMRLRNTRACLVGPSSDRLDELKFRTDEDYDEATRLFSGDKEVFIDPGDARGGRLFVRVEDPLPITVQAVIVRMDGGAG